MALETNPDLPFLAGYNADEAPYPMFPVNPETEVNEAGRIVYVVPRKDTISSAIAHVHDRYDIPDELEPDLGVLIQNYLRSSHNLEKAFSYWQAHRGGPNWDLEFQILVETQELTKGRRALRDHDRAACALGEFLRQFDVRQGNKRKPSHVNPETMEFEPAHLES